MPTINTNELGGVIRYDVKDWLAGLIPQFSTSVSVPHYGDGFAYTEGINPYRRPGQLWPGAEPAAATNSSVINGILKNAVINNTVAYLIGGDSVHENTIGSTNSLTNGATFPHAISAHGGHGSVTGHDVALYYIGTTKYLFYSWIDSTDGDVGRFNLSSTFDDDWLSTVPASGAVLDTRNTHPLKVGDDDMLYIGDGNNLHQLDGQTGANGTLTKNRLVLPKDYVITSMAKLPNYLVIFAYKSSTGGSFYRSEATAFFWDYAANDQTYSFPLSGNYVNGAFEYNGTVGCFVRGRSGAIISANKLSKMLIYDGTRFRPMIAFSEEIPGHGGVEVTDDMIQFNAAGVIYAYGSPYIGIPAGFNRITSGSGTTTEGMCKNFSSNILSASSGTTTSGGLEQFDTNHRTNAYFRTPFVSLAHKKYSKVQIKMVKVGFSGNANGDGNPFSLYINYNKGTLASQVINSLQTVTAAEVVKTYLNTYDGNALPITDAIQIYGVYGGSGATTANVPPVVEFIEVYYDYINI